MSTLTVLIDAAAALGAAAVLVTIAISLLLMFDWIADRYAPLIENEPSQPEPEPVTDLFPYDRELNNVVAFLDDGHSGRIA